MDLRILNVDTTESIIENTVRIVFNNEFMKIYKSEQTPTADKISFKDFLKLRDEIIEKVVQRHNRRFAKNVPIGTIDYLFIMNEIDNEIKISFESIMYPKKIFHVKIRETYEYVADIEATSVEEAMTIADEMAGEQKIDCVTNGDFVNRNLECNGISTDCLNAHDKFERWIETELRYRLENNTCCYDDIDSNKINDYLDSLIDSDDIDNLENYIDFDRLDDIIIKHIDTVNNHIDND